MLLGEVKQIDNADGILFEDVHDLIRYIRGIYDNAQDSSNATDESYKAANYLAFLMAYRDVDYATHGTDSNPLPVEHFLQPGVQSAMKALQFFSRKAGDHSNIMKKVDNYTMRFMSPEDGRRFFDYQCNKMDTYFKNKAKTLK
jgi:hypothetical protein